jgi:phospholipid/cholesterol/gamma-HCH transport system substrate-binding protein
MVTSSENVRALSASLEAINKTAENLAALSATLNTETSQIRGILDNTNTFTGTLAKNSDTIRRVLSNLNQVSGQLAGAHLDQTFKELQASVGQFHSVMSKINNNEGSLGLLVNDKNLYNNMNSSLKSLDNLMIDLNQHPSKYVNVTIFGGKKNKK